jgi:glycerol-3-phosphate acyltransferase PlsX
MRVLREAPGSRADTFADGSGGPVATVAVDALGADRGPAEVAAGARTAAEAGTRSILFGPEAELRAAFGAKLLEGVELVDAPVAISNDEEPARAVRTKPEASIVQAAQAVGRGSADALLSAGSTGAALAASLLHVKRLPGVYRPAVAVLLPLPVGRVLLLDAGANVEVRPEHLVQFAYMGDAFCRGVLGVDRPRVGLLSVGEESGKGTPEVVAAHDQLAAGNLEFAGNVEGDRLTSGSFDVVVTDGFTGNVALKLMEGTVRTLTGAIRDAVRSGTLSKVGGLLLRPKLSGLRERLDPEAVGGAYLLGLRRLVVICHGRSTERAIASALALADRGVEQRVVEKTAQALAAASVLRGDSADSPAREAGAASVGAGSFTSR